MIPNPFDYARITDVDYKAVVVDEPGSQGKVLITEKLTFDIHAASKDNPFWELWRDLPEDYIDGEKVEYKVLSVKQILEDGTEIVYDESSKLYWDDEDYTDTRFGYGPGKWYHSEGPYNEVSRDYECVFFYVDGIYREKVTFEIQYEMLNAALRYKDCSELYLSMYSEETIKYLKSYKGQILFPENKMPRTGNYYAHTYGTNLHEFPFVESDTLNPGYHTFAFNLDESDLKFKPYNQYIEFALVSYGADKHTFTNYASINDYYDDNALAELQQEQKDYESMPDDYNRKKIIAFFICFTLTILILEGLLKADNDIERKYNFYQPSLQMDYFRDIPSNLDPSFAADLVFCKHKPKKATEDGYAAIMLSLIRKGYIELEKINPNRNWNSYNVKIIVKHKQNPLFTSSALLDTPTEDFIQPENTFEPLTPTEELYFNLIIRHSHGTEISMNSFQSKISMDYEHTDSFVRKMEQSTVNIGISQGYFQKANYEQPKKELQAQSKFYMFMGIISLLVANLISYQTPLELAFGGYTILGIAFIFGAILLKKMSNKYVLLTQYGEDEYVKWRGLYNFLNSETLMNERTVVELPLWEQYLVYATAFGISEKVISALKIRCPDIDTSPMLSNEYYRSRSFYTSSRSFRRTARSTSHSYRSSSRLGGYGGYGGGGRGGGGGRRRSLI